jgi:hypothetical protein
MQFEDLKEFIDCYNPKNRNKRKATWSESNPDGRWRKFTYDDIIAIEIKQASILPGSKINPWQIWIIFPIRMYLR